MLHLALLGMRLVRLDDHLHEFVTHDVLLAEVDELDAFDVREHAFGFDQPTSFPRRQIDLGNVAGNHCLRAKTDARQKHKSGKVSHACVSSWTRLGDNQMPPRVKAASNYLNSRLASEEALRNGYDTALILNSNGKVAEAPGACLMIVRDGKIISPPVTSGILESITRATLIQLCREVLKLEVIEREVDRTELYVASEVFVCGTGEEITPIASVDRFELGDGSIGPITRQLESLYHDIARGIETCYPEWRTLV